MQNERKAVTRLTLDLQLGDIQKSFGLTKGDVNRRLEFTLIDGGRPFEIPGNWTAWLVGTKPDETELKLGCVVERGRVIYDLASGNQLSACEGYFQIWLTIFNEAGEEVYSPGVGVDVRPGPNTMNSEDQNTAIAELIGKINGTQEEVGEIQARLPELAREVQLSTLTITKNQWEDSDPKIAIATLPNAEFGENTSTTSYSALLLPVDNATRIESRSIDIFVKAAYMDSIGVVNIVFEREGEAPTMDLKYVVIAFTEPNETGEAFTVSAGFVGIGASSTDQLEADVEALEEDVKDNKRNISQIQESIQNTPGTETYVGSTPPEKDSYSLWVDTSVNPAQIKYKTEVGTWVVAAGGGGGGGGGSGDMELVNKDDWITKTVALGASCVINLSWSSKVSGKPTGNGTMRIMVNGASKLTREVAQGSVSPDIGAYLKAGDNVVDITISDSRGNSSTLNLTVNAVSLSITCSLDDSTAYTGDIPILYKPVGEVEKTVHFLIDGVEIDTRVVTASNRDQPYTIPAQAHGSHVFEVYFDAVIDGKTVPSNRERFDLICYEEGNTTPIITTTFRGGTFTQYATVPINYIVYTWGQQTSEVKLMDGDTVVQTYPAVDRTRQLWPYKAADYGQKNLAIVSGETVKPISLTVTERTVKAEAETANLKLYLSSEGRSNNEETPLTWSYEGVNAQMTGFNLKSDGWQPDDEGNTALRVLGDARVNIPFNIFGADFRTFGKTIEIEFATRNVMNYDAVVLSCWSGDRGIKITAQKALLKSERSEIFTQYKEDEHVRVAFVVEKQAENRLLAIYINGIMSGVVQYPEIDNFAQSPPVGITIGSNDCTVDIYNIRVYGNNLTRYQIVDNWIADTQDVDTMIDRDTRNDVFDAYGNIAVAKLPKDLPYMVVNAAKYEDLPQTETDEKTVSGFYKDPLHPERSFTFENAIMEIQGTSSLTYPRKNYRFKFKGGLVVNGKLVYDYKLRPTSYPTNVFTFKADHASSEGANNVELAMLYNETCPVKTPPQLVDPRVRQGIEGYPCVMFYFDGTNYNFLGKYNFNNDKSTAEVYGFKTGDESWEIRTNNTDMALWKDDNFAGNAWENTFAARYPKNSKNVTNLQALATWLKSTDTTAVDTEEEKAARLQKFKDEFENWFHKDAMIYNYIFTEMFLLMDNRAKNAFPTRYTEKDANGNDTSRWLILPYDYDSAIGINNLGQLTYGYHLEDTDLVGGHPVFNGQNSVLFVNIRLAFGEEIKTTYQSLRNDPAFAYNAIEKRFEDHQSVWGESIYNEDSRFKYIDPLIEDGDEDQLPRLQGSKEEQRKWWLYNRFRYLDSKYEAGDSLKDYIKIRTYDVADINVTPYADIYAAARFNDDVVKVRALRAKDEEGNDVHYTLQNPMSNGQEADVLIYSASQLSDVGDLSGLKALEANFSSATRLSRLKIGSSAAGYDNPNLKKLSVGNLTLLKNLDVRNCSALAQSVDLSGCANIEHVYFDGTAITGVDLPNGGILKTLHLPGTVTSLVIMNHRQLTDFVLPSYANITTLRLENMSGTVVDSKAILQAMPGGSRVRLLGIDWTVSSVEEIYSLYDKLDTFRGLDENGKNEAKAVVSGVIHVDMVSQSDLDELAERYPNVTIDYNAIASLVQFIDGDKVISRQVLPVGGKITVPANPTRENTAQYTYTFNGWGYDDKNIIILPSTATGEDLTFYAVYTATVNRYTIRFLNGTKVEQSESLHYGELPVYKGMTPTYTGEGSYMFTGWNPEVEPVTGAVDYVAEFVVKKALADYSWDEISAMSADGTAANYLAVGETKGIVVSGTVGTLEIDTILYVYIIGFDHNEELEGKGIYFGTFKDASGTDVCLVDANYQKGSTDGAKYFNMNHKGDSAAGGWAGCDLRYDILGSTDSAPLGYGAYPTTSRVGYNASPTCATNPVENTLIAALPADLRAVMKPMTTYADSKGDKSNAEENVTASVDYLPLLAEFEIFGVRQNANQYEKNWQAQYSYYAAGKSKSKKKHSSTSSSADWRVRSAYNGNYSYAFCGVTSLGSYAGQNANQSLGLAPIFKV